MNQNVELLRFTLESSPVAVCISQIKTGQVVFANQCYADLINVTLDEMIGISPKHYYVNPQDYDEMLEQLGKGNRVSGRLIELQVSNDNYKVKWVLASYVEMEYQNEPCVLGWFNDISDRKAMEELMQHLAHYDSLTDVPNRILFADRLQRALTIAKREKINLACMFIDLDKFKPINDIYGYNVGDLLLKEVAKRIQGCVRESDTVGRVGGDVFVVLLPVVDTEQDALGVAEKIRNSLNQPFELTSHKLGISSSMGVAIYPQHGDEETLLMKNADTAMYYAKADGRDNVKLYQSSM